MAVKKKANVAKQAAPAKAAGGDKSLAQVEEVAMNAAGGLGVGQFKAWLAAYFHPYQAYGKEKTNAGLASAAATLGLIGLVEAVVAIIVMALMLSSRTTLFPGPYIA